MSKLPNKDKIVDAIRGDNNLIGLTFNCRTVSVILDSKLKEADESEGNIGSVTEDERYTFLQHEVVVCIKKHLDKGIYLHDEQRLDLIS